MESLAFAESDDHSVSQRSEITQSRPSSIGKADRLVGVHHLCPCMLVRNCLIIVVRSITIMHLASKCKYCMQNHKVDNTFAKDIYSRCTTS